MTVTSTVRSLGRAAGFAAWTSGVVNAHRLARRFDAELRQPSGKQAFIDVWSRWTFPLLGVQLHRVAGDLPRRLGPFLVIANHRSPLDILVLQHLVGGVILSHHGVADFPVVGDAARATDTIFVDRADSRSGAKAIRTMRRRLREKRNVIVFPEGTTYAGDEVRPFKRGAFSSAKRMPEVSVLPVGLAYLPGHEFVDESFKSHAARLGRRRRTPVWASIGSPFAVPATPGDEERLRDEVQRLVDRSAQARDLVGG